MRLAGAAAAALTLAAIQASACDYPGPPPGLGQPTEARAATGDIRWAGYSDATTRYGHGVLGDAIEAGGLRAEAGTLGGCDLAVILPDDHVFEDIAPRIADLDGDGRNEIVVVETDVNLGGSLAVYGLRDGALVKLAETQHYGQPRRWLAPAGIADFNGDGLMDIAYVDRPHLARTLRIVTYENGVLREIAAASGLTNHRIGDSFITGGVRDCGQGPEMVLTDTDWSRVVVARLSPDNQLSAEAVAPFSPAAVDAALACR
ncbi:VCBS repeat-containing protein [Rhodobacterales bacterium HKCCE3408]|nr:VCBS repeat-containing protein [Rhodobacterales bacterium HKCCE3408]